MKKAQGLVFTTTALGLILGLSACRDDASGIRERTVERSATPGTDSSGRVETTEPAPHDTIGTDSSTVPSGNNRTASPAWSRSELARDLRTFLVAIEENDRTAFIQSLSQQTSDWIASDPSVTMDRVWEGARNTLGAIAERRITVVGGSGDSVAIRIDGVRTVDGEVTRDPVIVDLLRERNVWKVSYPGLHYPMEHNQR